MGLNPTLSINSALVGWIGGLNCQNVSLTSTPVQKKSAYTQLCEFLECNTTFSLDIKVMVNTGIKLKKAHKHLNLNWSAELIFSNDFFI